MTRFGLAPSSFWSLSLNEWRWLTDAVFGFGDAMDASALTSLLQQYPDKTHAR